MEIHSSVGRMSSYKPTNSAYHQLDREYCRTGFTYKSNEILHKISENTSRQYPYELLLYITKTFHFNQFQIVFFSHILSDVQPCYNSQPQLFNEDIQIASNVSQIIQGILNANHSRLSNMQQFNVIIKSSLPMEIPLKKEEYQLQQDEEESRQIELTAGQLKKIYLYLLVLGYAVKYYLNEQSAIKPYDEEIKLRLPTFFINIFNKWAKKYGNTVLATTPRRINSYYLSLAAQMESDEHPTNQTDCQYRNYNQIVEELIKATTDGEDPAEMDKELNDNQ